MSTSWTGAGLPSRWWTAAALWVSPWALSHVRCAAAPEPVPEMVEWASPTPTIRRFWRGARRARRTA
eukprot:8073098-Alexandrium_andersonii.AAC.1